MTGDYVTRKLTTCLAGLRDEFRNSYGGKSHLQEIIPADKSESFPIESHHLEQLHAFASKNAMYHNSYESTISGIPCIVYEGDANRYWLSSIGHSSSQAPFSPTWIVSAYTLSLLARDLGFGELVDVGSGDGRIAFCAKMLGMDSFSIEVDYTLSELQNNLSEILDFKPHCADATTFDYSSLELRCPIMAIGGIAQMGGTTLASAVLEKIVSDSRLDVHGWIFTGTYLSKYTPDPKNEAGWGTLIESNGLRVLQTVLLPTAWTFHESKGTPYVFAASNK